MRILRPRNSLLCVPLLTTVFLCVWLRDSESPSDLPAAQVGSSVTSSSSSSLLEGSSADAKRTLESGGEADEARRRNSKAPPPSPKQANQWRDPCRLLCGDALSQCIASVLRNGESTLPSIEEWGPEALKEQQRKSFSYWSSQGGFTLDNLVTVNSCAYHTRTRWNAHGMWLHIVGHNVTVLRWLADGYNRGGNIRNYIRDVVRSGPPFTTPVSVYVAVTDVPCNPEAPFLTFFRREGSGNILIPDNSFVRSEHGSWVEVSRSMLETAKTQPFARRLNRLFFRGSPTHPIREMFRKELTERFPTFADVQLSVVERNRSFVVPLSKHADYQYLMAMRGKSSSSRDKYLNLLGSVIVWAVDAADDDRPWFQFYHALWKPYYNYIPMERGGSAVCKVQWMMSPEAVPIAERIAAHGLEVGTFLTQSVADQYLRDVLLQYGALQSFRVPQDPMDFVNAMRKFVKRRHKMSLVMPDDKTPVKFYFEKWLSRRVKQMHACRSNNTFNGAPIPTNSVTRCTYL